MARIVVRIVLLLYLVNGSGEPSHGEEANGTADYVFVENKMIPMRDGVRLATHLYRPPGDGPFPTLLMRTPYGKRGHDWGQAGPYTAKGYAVAVQDCRGRGASEGVWDPFRHDPQDGFDTQEWIGAQSWCNGKIGTFGGSYVGWTQWAAAPQGSRFLKAMVPVVPFGNPYHDIVYPNGALQLALSFGWGAAVGGIQATPAELPHALEHLPLRNWDSQFGQDVFFLDAWAEHPSYDDYWRQRGIQQRYADVTVPVLNVGGWYDIFSKTTIELVDQVRDHSRNRQVRTNQYVIMGPWAHGVGRRTVGQLDFGESAELNIGQLQQQWFDYWLKDEETGVEDWPAYYLFVMGENQWRGEHEWPLKRTRFTPYYFSQTGEPSMGELTLTPSTQLPNASFTYNPRNPVPTTGGNNLMGAPAGPYDQRSLDGRSDVLTYQTPPLKEAIEVTGPVQVVLFAASTATDTDFTAKLVDVHPDGAAYNLCDGIVRARYRESDSHPSLIDPHKIYRYDIDLWVTSNLFRAGHRIRIDVSSSNFPRFNRNPNTGHEFGTQTEMVKAVQTVYHDADHASHVVLPIIPR